MAAALIAEILVMKIIIIDVDHAVVSRENDQRNNSSDSTSSAVANGTEAGTIMHHGITVAVLLFTL